jgi:hypothetical protein
LVISTLLLGALATKVPCPAPFGVRDRISGRLNVVEPSPTPNIVPIAVKSAASVVRFFRDPSQVYQPVGGVAAA